MKQWANKKISFLMLGIISSFYLLAQDDKKLDIDRDVNKGDNSTWYQQPWVWVVGGAVFILLLVGMLKGNGIRKD